MTAPWPSYASADEGLVDNPMYLGTSTTALTQTYEEVPSSGSRLPVIGGGRSTTQNPIYGVGPKHAQVALQHPTTLSLDQMYKINPVEEQRRGGRRDCRLSYSCLLCLISLLIMLLSGEYPSSRE